MAERSSAKGRVVLNGALTIRTVDTAHARLVETLRMHSDLEIDCESVTEADVSLVQVLLAACESARRAGKTVTLAAPAGGAVHEALSQAGVVPIDAESRVPNAVFGAFDRGV